MNKHIWCEISVLALIAFLATTSNGLCRKLEKLTELHISGYKAHIIHTNACIEVRKSIIEPNMLDLEVPGGERFRRTFTTDCCCEVTSKTLELVGRPFKNKLWLRLCVDIYNIYLRLFIFVHILFICVYIHMRTILAYCVQCSLLCPSYQYNGTDLVRVHNKTDWYKYL